MPNALLRSIALQKFATFYAFEMKSFFGTVCQVQTMRGRPVPC